MKIKDQTFSNIERYLVKFVTDKSTIKFTAVGIFTTLFLFWFSGLYHAYETNMTGDLIPVIAILKNIAEYSTFYQNSNLGWPSGINGNHYPLTNYVTFLVAWMWGFFGLGAQSLYLAVAFSLVLLNTAAFVWLAHKLKCNLRIAFIASLPFVFSDFFISRVLGHFFLTDIFVIPLGIALSLYIIDEIKLSKPELFFVAIIAGCGNVYYSFFSLFLIGISSLSVIINSPKPAKIRSSLAVMLLVASPVLILLVGQALFAEGSVIKRSAGDQPVFALRFMDAFIPNINHLTNKGWREYLEHIRPKTEGREFIGYTALVGVIISLWVTLALLPMQNADRNFEKYRDLYRRLNIISVFVLLLVIFSLPFGAGSAFNLFFTASIRAQNRVSIVILCLGLIAVMLVVHHVMRQKPWGTKKIWSMVYLLPLVLLVYLDIGPDRNFVRQSSLCTQITDRDGLDFSQKMALSQCKGELEAHLAPIFAEISNRNLQKIAQFPVVPFAEAGPSANRSDYFGFLPYLVQPEDLNISYSYGMPRGSTVFNGLREVEKSLAHGKTSQSLKRIACVGYDAILIDRFAYKDRGKKVKRSLLRSGLKPVAESSGYALFDVANSKNSGTASRQGEGDDVSAKAEQCFLKTVSAEALRSPNNTEVFEKILADGWDKAEAWGVWSRRKTAKIRFRLNPEDFAELGKKQIELKLRGLFSGFYTRRNVRIIGRKGQTVYEGEMGRGKGDIMVVLDLDKRIKTSDGIVGIDIEADFVTSPKSLGINSDSRMIGIGLLSVRVL